jgi:hypothetical protein
MVPFSNTKEGAFTVSFLAVHRVEMSPSVLQIPDWEWHMVTCRWIKAVVAEKKFRRRLLK